MSDVGTSIFSHGEIVRFGVHRKLLYLEDHDDYHFLHGIVNRSQPKLLHLPFTRMAKGGRTTPPQIKELIRLLRQFLPKEATIHIFVLVDADLRQKSILDKEKEIYATTEEWNQLNVKIYYHCWAAREWENWLLINESFLYEILCNDAIKDEEQAIKRLRNQIQQYYPNESIFSTSDSLQHSQPITTSATTSSSHPQHHSDNNAFEDWFKKELSRHFQKLLKTLTAPMMEGINKISSENEKQLQCDLCNKFLNKAGISDDMMNRFDHLRKRVEQFIGYQLQQESPDYKNKKEEIKRQQRANASTTDKETEGQKKDNVSKSDEEENTRRQWLSDRKLPETAEMIESLSTLERKEVTKWIDAKLFFHQLTHDKDNEIGTDLDDYWKKAFSLETSTENKYDRYFTYLDPQNSDQWPEDFNTLLEIFQKFIEAP
ncbi:unnamed protein product [Rotaria sp. Silwood2]|nr:unnamed protein product [Rotaria sp. Silwood2]CAF3127018.1 unnamed protein product [Rotaria sp. Silwood2]CAF3390740.1 unnamed protein product [Rotaria sp. Silwood2]CAF4217626.1 unnamed protein product [Rotaria sp. Silwood2]CAF4438600.1 unnamed protein product [Rotaria sp. Silwood2]